MQFKIFMPTLKLRKMSLVTALWLYRRDVPRSLLSGLAFYLTQREESKEAGLIQLLCLCQAQETRLNFGVGNN